MIWTCRCSYSGQRDIPLAGIAPNLLPCHLEGHGWQSPPRPPFQIGEFAIENWKRNNNKNSEILRFPTSWACSACPKCNESNEKKSHESELNTSFIAIIYPKELDLKKHTHILQKKKLCLSFSFQFFDVSRQRNLPSWNFTTPRWSTEPIWWHSYLHVLPSSLPFLSMSLRELKCTNLCTNLYNLSWVYLLICDSNDESV